MSEANFKQARKAREILPVARQATREAFAELMTTLHAASRVCDDAGFAAESAALLAALHGVTDAAILLAETVDEARAEARAELE